MTQTSEVRKLSPLWTKGLRDKEKADFEAYVRNSTGLLIHLRKIIEEFELSIFLDESNEAQYEDPSWGYLQAHRNGRKETLRTLKKMTDHLD